MSIFQITTTGGDIRVAEATIWFNGKIVGFVGNSGHESVVKEQAEAAVEAALDKLFAPVLESIKSDPNVSPISRYEFDDDYAS